MPVLLNLAASLAKQCLYTDLCGCPAALSELNISNNQLTGTLPSSWSRLEQVSMLYTLLLHMHCLITIYPLAFVLVPNSLGSCGGGLSKLVVQHVW